MITVVVEDDSFAKEALVGQIDESITDEVRAIVHKVVDKLLDQIEADHNQK